MNKIPCFHYHPKDREIILPTNLMIKNAPDFGIKQNKCPVCGKWGFLSVQRDRNGNGYRLLGQGHRQASRLFNQLPVYGVLLAVKDDRFFFQDEASYIAGLYDEGEKVLEFYDDYAVVPIWRDDFNIISSFTGKNDEDNAKEFALAIAPLYRGVTGRQFGVKLNSHMAKLVRGFDYIVETIPRINLTYGGVR